MVHDGCPHTGSADGQSQRRGTSLVTVKPMSSFFHRAHRMQIAWPEVGTDPADNIQLAKDLAKTFRCIDLLDDSPAGKVGVMNTPRIFQPFGPTGKNNTPRDWLFGMFTLTKTSFNPVHNNGCAFASIHPRTGDTFRAPRCCSGGDRRTRSHGGGSGG